MTTLPLPDANAIAHSAQLVGLIRHEIALAGGWIDFSRYMHLALYAPGFGYYSGGAQKFGKSGDFLTAPEISPLFAQTLARQAAQVLRVTHGSILELGAGTGRLAGGLLQELQRLEQLPQQYFILEVSGDLREQQRDFLQKLLPADLFGRVRWLDRLPEVFTGLILGNEVLDALPVHVVKVPEKDSASVLEMGVSYSEAGFFWSERPAGQAFSGKLEKLRLPPGYTTELCPAATGLIGSLANILMQGVILLVDYGFPRREYYHPQRNQGTLMCHYRHHAHADPFFYPGLQDITAHVDFTAIAEAGVASGLQLLGYCGQAQYLINCGMVAILSQQNPSDLAAYAPLVSQAQKLLSAAEMGELFKVIALGKGVEIQLLGFARGDKRHAL